MGIKSQKPKIPPNWLLNSFYTILITLWVILSLDIIWPVLANLNNPPRKVTLPGQGGINYLIIAPQALQESASAWGEYRNSTGYYTQVVLLASGQARIETIRDLIHKAYTYNGKPYPFYVLLMGHAHPFSSYPDTFLPATHFSVDLNRSSSYGTDPIASDDGYASTDPYGIPDHILPIYIGRIPIRTEEEGFLLLRRTQAYEKSPPFGEGRAQIELVTSNAGFGAQYDPIFSWMLKTLIQKLLPSEYQWHMLDGNSKSPYNYPIYSFPNEVAKRFDSGALALVYIGHGQPEMLCCASSLNGDPGPIFNAEDAGLIQNANTSIGILTACSTGTYDLNGDNLSVVESIYLAPGGPVATYSSSAWINGTLNGRLVVDIFEALLIDKASTLGEWVGLVETWPVMPDGHTLLTQIVKELIPRFSGVYQKYPFLSPMQAKQELDIQHATYNLFGDPALRIAYPQTGMKVSPSWLWQIRKGYIAFSGKSNLPSDQEVSISLEIIPGSVISQKGQPTRTIDRYLQANNLVIGRVSVYTKSDGSFSGRIIIPPDTPNGKYLLRALSILSQNTYAAVQPVYIGWPPVIEILSSAIFWWSIIAVLLICKSLVLILRHRQHYHSDASPILNNQRKHR